MKSEIISLLRERQDYVSGQELCERFGVSRTAVWKAVEQLKKEGYRIEAVRNRGYFLTEDTGVGAEERYNQYELASRMKTRWAGRAIRFYESVDSTNARAKQEAEQGALHGTLVAADLQTAGRGRRGRGWSSPAGTNIYFTLILRPDILPDRASMLTLVMAHAVAEGIGQTLRETAVSGKGAGEALPPVGIKWPNDIVVDGRKVCGILTEMSLSVEQAAVQYVVIGVGINVHEQDFGAELADRAVSLDSAWNVRLDRSALTANIMAAFEADYENFTACGDLAGLRESYNAMLVNRDREVCVLDPRGEYRGVARGITATGELLVELPDGTTVEVYAGEVSVRGIYGYV